MVPIRGSKHHTLRRIVGATAALLVSNRTSTEKLRSSLGNLRRTGEQHGAGGASRQLRRRLRDLGQQRRHDDCHRPVLHILNGSRMETPRFGSTLAATSPPAIIASRSKTSSSTPTAYTAAATYPNNVFNTTLAAPDHSCPVAGQHPARRSGGAGRSLARLRRLSRRDQPRTGSSHSRKRFAFIWTLAYSAVTSLASRRPESDLRSPHLVSNQ